MTSQCCHKGFDEVINHFQSINRNILNDGVVAVLVDVQAFYERETIFLGDGIK